MGKRNRGATQEQVKSRFQEVGQEGSAAARAEKPTKAGDEDEDDVEFIRNKNAKAFIKRQRKEEKKVQKQGTVKPDQMRSDKADKNKFKQGKGEESKLVSESGRQTKTKTSHKKDERIDEDNNDEHSFSEDEDEEEEEELAMQPSHYRNQEGYSFEEESGEGSDFEELNVVFDHFNPKEEDFHGIRQFFRKLLNEKPFDVSGLVDIIIAQSGAVGTVVKVAGESEVYGVTSVVSFAHYRHAECMKQIGAFILSKCPSEYHSKFEKLISGSGKMTAGLILDERMVNMPSEMALPLMNGLFDEIRWSQEDQPDSEKSKYKFDKYIVLTRILRFASAKRRKGKKGKQAGEEEATGGECVYLKAEDQVLRSLAEMEFEFCISDREESEGARSYGLVMLVPASAAGRVVDEVKEVVGDEAIRNQMDLDAPP